MSIGTGDCTSQGHAQPNAEEILNDPEIDIVVELVGGIHPAKEFILGAIQRKKHAVTATRHSSPPREKRYSARLIRPE